MPEGNEPLIRLEPGGRAPILSYNVPEPAIYFGKNIIELEYDEDLFSSLAWQSPGEPTPVPPTPPVDEEDLDPPPDEEDVADPAPNPPLPPDDEEFTPPTPVPPSGDDEFIPPVPGPFPPGDNEEVVHPLGNLSTGRPRRAARIRDHRGRIDTADLSDEALEQHITRSMKSGFSDRHILPNANTRSGNLRFVEEPELKLESDLPVSPELQSLTVEEVMEAKKAGKELDFYTTMYGTIRHRYITKPAVVEPAFLLVETYRLASYLGSYGAGRVIKTFSLLPGERTTISVKTFRKSERERKQASSILDSFTEESATDFERTIENEQSDKETYEKSFEYHSEAEANASWGWGKARVKGGVAGGTNAAREEFAKNSTTATDKHAQKASAKREVEVDTSYESRETEEEETSTEREVENINLSRTLNFVFRQMNQEFVTISSLVDVRVAFFNGFAESRREVTLPELDALLETYVKREHRDRVRADIRGSLGNILDYQGRIHDDFIEEREIDADNRYLRVRSEKTSTYSDPITGTEIAVPGIIVSATKNSMRTDGIFVEALLGTSGALDQYAEQLQALEVARGEAELAKEKATAERLALGNEVVRDEDTVRVDLIRQLSQNGVSSPLEFFIRTQDGSPGRHAGETEPSD
ncbi:hypothetical protein ACNS7O_16525 (plasmid) [Haloferacaceae archaeon DSL9]